MATTKSTTAFQSEAIRFPCRNKVIHIHPENLIRLQADSNYTIIHAADHQPFIMAKVLKDYEAMLRPFDFIRVNRSLLLNKKHIKAVLKNGQLQLDDDTRITIPRRRKILVKSTILACLFFFSSIFYQSTKCCN